MDLALLIGGIAILALIGWVATRKPKLPEDAGTPAAKAPAEAPAAKAPEPDAATPEAPAAEAAPAAAPAEGAAPAVAEEAAEEAAPEAEPEPAPAPVQDPAHAKQVKAVAKGLAATRGGFISRLAKLFGAREGAVDQGLLEEIEEVLITADLGVKTSDRILQSLREQMSAGTLTDEASVWESLKQQAGAILNVDAKPMDLSNKPALILVVGVNGVGKTTTIGKLASRYTAEGKKVLLAAGDTFRAAAVIQLEVWGRRVKCPVVKGKDGADPGSVIFDAVKQAENEGFDLVIADTAGRLHTKAPLMDELKKVDRTASKALGDRPVDEILLVLDSTTGQNAVQQMHMFRQALNVSGVALTKLDGTAKGGVILGIVDEHKVPIRFIGLGEKIEDLREFDMDVFVEALFAKPDGETIAA